MPHISLLDHELGKLQAQSLLGHDAMSDRDNGKKALSSANFFFDFDHVPYNFVTFRDLSCIHLAHPQLESVLITILILLMLFLTLCHVQSVAHLVGASVLAAHSVILVGLGGMEVEDKHQVPALAHHHLIALILQSMLHCRACELGTHDALLMNEWRECKQRDVMGLEKKIAVQACRQSSCICDALSVSDAQEESTKLLGVDSIQIVQRHMEQSALVNE